MTAQKSTIVALARLAQSEEERLLARVDPNEAGSAQCWAALPTVDHNSAFKHEQVVRLHAVAEGSTPPDFPVAEHRSEELYGSLSRDASEVAKRARVATDQLVAAVLDTAEADLFEAGRHSWLRGRALWLQVVVRAFWHPMGHVGEYYAAHGATDLAVGVAEHALASADYLGAPDLVVGMSLYNLACARAAAGSLAEAAEDVKRAIELNGDLRTNAEVDRDLAVVREQGLLDART